MRGIRRGGAGGWRERPPGGGPLRAMMRPRPHASIGPAASGFLMRLALSCAALLILALPGLGLAQDAPPGTVRVASRLFLVGEVPGESTRAKDFLPLTEVPWAWRLIQDDPVLDGVVVHLRQRPSPPSLPLQPRALDETVS